MITPNTRTAAPIAIHSGPRMNEAGTRYAPCSAQTSPFNATIKPMMKSTMRKVGPRPRHARAADKDGLRRLVQLFLVGVHREVKRHPDQGVEAADERVAVAGAACHRGERVVG